jgi:hypothetical protein
MGILDKAKDKAKDAMGKAQELAGEAKAKAHDLAEEHADQLKAGIDKTEALANKATKGKFSDKIEAVGEKAAGLVPAKDEAPDAEAPTTAEPEAPAAAAPADEEPGTTA